MSDEEDIRLRDQFAIAAMQSLLSQYKQKTHIIEYGSCDISGRNETSNNTINTYEIELDQEYIKRITSKVEFISNLSYKIADEMRKARLKSFT